MCIHVMITQQSESPKSKKEKKRGSRSRMLHIGREKQANFTRSVLKTTQSALYL